METEKKGLIAYFSQSGENYVNGKIISLPIGNTEIIAGKINELTGFDLFKIESLDPYPSDYKETTRIAKIEHNEDIYPKMKTAAPDLSAYEIIYLGYPNWWSCFPMVVGTFLRDVDWNGKTIVPFCTHEGSGMCGLPEIAELCPGVTIAPELLIKGSKVSEADELIRNWVKSNN